MKQTVPLRTEREIHAFLRCLKEWNSNYYIGALIGINWGLRCSDILALQVGDLVAGAGKRVQIIDRLMVCELKTGKTRHILVTDKMRVELHAHIRSMESWDAETPLVLSQKKSIDGRLKPISRQHFWYVIAEAARRAGLKGVIGTHTLRKTYAYQAWRTGIRVDEIQKEFGHVNLGTTHRYTMIPDERLEKIYTSVDFSSPAKTKPKW